MDSCHRQQGRCCTHLLCQQFYKPINLLSTSNISSGSLLQFCSKQTYKCLFCNHMWQSQVEIKHYSVAYFDRITTFKSTELLLRAGLIHTVCRKCIWAPPTLNISSALQCFGRGNNVLFVPETTTFIFQCFLMSSFLLSCFLLFLLLLSSSFSFLSLLLPHPGSEFFSVINLDSYNCEQ